MKTIGMLGGMSWESTRSYYNHLNIKVRDQLGGLNSAKLILSSVNFAELETCLREGNWRKISQILSSEARRIEGAGADGIILCTNTMHKIFDHLQQAIDIPIFHIADTLGEALQKAHVSKIGLLGTRFTMQEDFYSQRLKEEFQIETIVPDKDDMAVIDQIIFKELCQGIVSPSSKAAYISIMDKLISQGAQGIALACTEIEILIKPEEMGYPVFDATEIHADFAVNWALAT